MLADLSVAASISKAPEIALEDLEGNTVKVAYSNAAATLVAFWATWCRSCREDLPMFSKLVDAHGSAGFRVVAIALQSGKRDEVEAFLERAGVGKLPYPMLMGDERTRVAFGDLEMVPTAFLVARNGDVLATYAGESETAFERLDADVRRFVAPPNAAQ
ncbi:MAG: TlpA disulfide reductase family protein [Candidatus Binatia bacterium]